MKRLFVSLSVIALLATTAIPAAASPQAVCTLVRLDISLNISMYGPSAADTCVSVSRVPDPKQQVVFGDAIIARSEIQCLISNPPEVWPTAINFAIAWAPEPSDHIDADQFCMGETLSPINVYDQYGIRYGA